MTSLEDLLKPHKTSFSKKRYGKYVLHPELVHQCDVLYRMNTDNGILLEYTIKQERDLTVKVYNKIEEVVGENVLLHTNTRYLRIVPENLSCIILEYQHSDEFDLASLLANFTITHVHGDNCDAVIPGTKMPKILHITLVNKKLLPENLEVDDSMYPTTYDFPCNPQVPDLELPFLGSNKFTVDWFTHQTPIWWPFVSPYMNQETHYLEIGSFEGRSVSWMCRQILKHPASKAYAVDTWEGSVEHSEDQKDGLLDRFLGSTHDVKDKVVMLRGFSSEVLKRAEVMARQYDIMYVDGDHHCWSALEDAVLCFPLLKSGGLLIFDDYMYGTITSHTSPHMGINSFVHAYREKIDILHSGYQVFLRKK